MPVIKAVGIKTALRTIGDRHHGSSHLVHGLSGRFLGLHPELDIVFDSLYDNDRVVHHDADRQHQAEKRQVIERKPKCLHDRECSDQRDRDSQKRNDRRPPSLQEHQHHDQDQSNRFKKCVDDRLDRLFDELSRVVNDGVLQAGREKTWTAFSSVARTSWAVFTAFEPGN